MTYIKLLSTAALLLISSISVLTAQTNTVAPPPPSTNSSVSNSAAVATTNTNSSNTASNATVNNIAYSNYGNSPVNISGYKSLRLGMNAEEIRSNIQNERLLVFADGLRQRIDDIPDERDDFFIKLGKTDFINSGYLLFKNDALYSIRIEFNKKQIAYVEILKSLSGKYGPGKFLNSDKLMWQNGDNLLVFERPNVVKYLKDSEAQKSYSNYIQYKNYPARKKDELLGGL